MGTKQNSPSPQDYHASYAFFLDVEIQNLSNISLLYHLKSLLMKVKEESEKDGLSSTFRKPRSWHLVPSLHGKQMGKPWKQCQTLFWGAPKSLQMVTAAMKLKDAYSLEGKL